MVSKMTVSGKPNPLTELSHLPDEPDACPGASGHCLRTVRAGG
jgi:hypothetical protein